MTISEALKNSIEILKRSNVESPIQKSKILLSNILQKSKEYLLINENEFLSDTICNEFFAKINEMVSGTPLQYLTHKQEFMGIDFYVDENVLIPRPDTEILVEEVLNLVKDKNNISIIDMCTGSGAIAVSIAKYTNVDKIYAVDISEKALEIAKKNAIKNNVNEKIEFINSNMFEKVNCNMKFDIIVSNPPYIETNVINNLEIQVQKEPKIALDGGRDGLDFYRRLLIDSKKRLKDFGAICMEIGYNQGKVVTELFSEEYKNVYCKKDLAGNDRVVVCLK